MRESGEEDFTAATLGIGRNDKDHGAFHGFLAEATRRFGMNSLYSRLEVQQVETGLLLTGHVGESDALTELRDSVTSLTIGGVRDIWRAAGYEVGIGGDLVFYGVPQRLEAAYGSRPVSFHIFMRVRPPARMGRMWNMTLTRPMKHDAMSVGHGGHQMGGAQKMLPGSDSAHADHTMPTPVSKPSTPAPDPHAAHKPGATPSRAPASPGTKAPVAQATDPVCGLIVDPSTAPKATVEGQTYHFCSEEHRQLFEQNPAKYLPQKGGSK
jgi:YHS domain-containing protein